MTVSGEGSGGGRRLGSREKALLILLGIVAVLAVAFMLLVNGGDEDEVAGPSPTPPGTSSPSPTPAATPTGEPSDDGELPPLTPEAFEGRDPFQPLLVEGPVDGGPGPSPTPSPGGTARPIDDEGRSKRVALLDIFSSDGERMATVEVDGQEFTVAEGDLFADNFRALELTKRCGTFVFGDERFTLCIGQEVLK